MAIPILGNPHTVPAPGGAEIAAAAVVPGTSNMSGGLGQFASRQTLVDPAGKICQMSSGLVSHSPRCPKDKEWEVGNHLFHLRSREVERNLRLVSESWSNLTQLKQWQSAFPGIDDLCAAQRRDSTRNILYPTASHSILRNFRFWGLSLGADQRQVRAKMKMPLTICSSPVYAISAYSGVYRKTLQFWKPCKKRMIEAGPIAKLFQVLKIWNFSKPIPQNDQIHPSNAPQNPTKLRHNPSNLSPNPTNLVSKYDSNQSYLRIKPSSPCHHEFSRAWIWCEGPHRSVVRYVLGLRVHGSASTPRGLCDAMRCIIIMTNRY